MGLYIQMHSMHGLFRSQNLELGRDEDTGGQIVYVLELAKHLSKLKKIDKIDIITRKIIDSKYPGYCDEIEKINEKVSIIRIECGPKKYIKKVKLWNYLNEFVENTKKYIKKIKRKPDILQSNYADSGLVCAKLSKELNIPQIHTGHSLGKPKMQRLGVTEKNIHIFNKLFNFDKRLNAEQKTIDSSVKIIVSTEEERKQQYKGYKLKNLNKFIAIPPGVDLKKFFPPNRPKLSKEEREIKNYFENILDQNLKHPERRLITTFSRLDKRKNIHGLIKAFSEDRKLQAKANLVIFAKTLEGKKNQQKLIKKINRLIRKHNLYENIALPGIQLEYEKKVPEYYRFINKKKGVFINPALIEPFGLTIIEASFCGVPVIATNKGGPKEIIEDEKTGLLINPSDSKDIAKKIKKLINNDDLWESISKNALKETRKKYSWNACAKKYFKTFNEIIKK